MGCSPASSSSVASAERSGANQKACTEEGKDPNSAGQKLQCCTGLRSCLGDWSGHGNWHYLCKSSCDSRGSFLSLKQSAKAASKIAIVSYNLYWWNVKQNNRFGDIHSRISGEQPFDLIGVRESEWPRPCEGSPGPIRRPDHDLGSAEASGNWCHGLLRQHARSVGQLR